MKRLKLLLLFFFLTSAALVKADVQFGDGIETPQYYPLDKFYESSYLQSVFEMSKLGPGEITGIKLYSLINTPYTYGNVKVYLKEMDVTDSPTDRIIDGTLVYSGNLSIDGDHGWKEILFTEPFTYSHENNLVVLVQHETGDYIFDHNQDWSCHLGTGTSNYDLIDSPLVDAVPSNTEYRMDIVFMGINAVNPGSVSGKVTNGDGSPLAMANVTLMGFDEIITGFDGQYSFTDLGPSDYTIKCHREGYLPTIANITISPDENTVLDFVLVKPDPAINPTSFTETMSPNEYRISNLGILNNGDGQFDWYAHIELIPELEGQAMTPFRTGGPTLIRPNIKKPRWDNSSLMPSKKASKHAKPQVAFDQYFRSQDVFSVAYGNNSGEFGYFNNEDLTSYTPLMDVSEGNDLFSAMDFRRSNSNELFLIDYDGNLYLQEIDDEDNCVFNFIKNVEVPAEDMVTGMATDPTSGMVFYSTMNSLYMLDPITFEESQIGDFGPDVNIMLDIAIDDKGYMFGVDYADNLLSIDKITAMSGIIGYIGVMTNYDKGLTFDPASSQLMMSVIEYVSEESQLRVVDPTTGGSSLLGGLPNDLYMPNLAISYDDLTPLWLSLDKMKGSAPALGGSSNIGVHFNAADLIPGQILRAKIHIVNKKYMHYDYAIDVKMIIGNDVLPVIEYLNAELTDPTMGVVNLDWEMDDDSSIEMYRIFMNNEVIAMVENNQYQMMLPDYGTYSFKVSAILDDGKETAPTGPEVISWFIPEPCEITEDIAGKAWQNHFVYVYDTLKNCGDGFLSFEISIVDDPSLDNFITEIEPMEGTISPGNEQIIRYTYDATDMPLGSFSQRTKTVTNAPIPYDEFMLAHIFAVYEPAMISGQVRDTITNERLNGVQVIAIGENEFTTYTDKFGEYTLYLDEGTYDVFYSLLGYQLKMSENVEVDVENPTEINKKLKETPYSPASIMATVNAPPAAEPDTECLVEWTLPSGPYEILYDGDNATNFVMGAMPGSAFAVKFMPTGYPAMVTGAKFYVGDGSFPEGSNFLGSDMKVSVYAPNEAGLPGEMLQEKIITCDQYGWIEAYNVFDVVLDEGYFFIAYTQVNDASMSPPIGVDENIPIAYKSYTFSTQTSVWENSAAQDLMIRAIVDGPNDDNIIVPPSVTVSPSRLATDFISQNRLSVIAGKTQMAKVVSRPDLSPTREVINYELARITVENPNGNIMDDPSEIIVPISTELFYNDLDFDGLEAGHYAYKVRARYDTDETSDWRYSNIVAHNLYANVVITVSLTNGASPIGATVELSGLRWPMEVYSATVENEDGIIYLPQDVPQDWFFQGDYMLKADKAGFKKYEPDNAFEIYQEEYSMEIILQERTYPVLNLVVDPLTSDATWNTPLVTEVREKFDDTETWPEDWDTFSFGIGWEIETEYSSPYWSIPARDNAFVVANDDKAGASNDGSMDMIVTPPLDLRASPDFNLYFDSYFDGMFSSTATIYYTLDNGGNWVLMGQLEPSPDWVTYEIPLEDFSGPEGDKNIRFAFVHSDNGNWASGWALDNITVSNGAADPSGYTVFLDDATQGETVLTDWFYPNLVFGKTYTASVAANYSSGLSDKEYYTFTSDYLIPALEVEGSIYEEDIILEWLTPRFYTDNGYNGDIPENLMGFDVFIDDPENPVEFIEATGAENYVFTKTLMPGTYDLYVSAVYDLTPYGKPAERGYSEQIGPIEIELDYGYELPFFEDWTTGSFETRSWNPGENWVIIDNSGIDEPVAAFYFNPLLTDYSSSLISPPINASMLYVGKIKLDFDLKLDNLQKTSEEKFKVEIGFDGMWSTLIEFDNVDSFDWQEVSLDVSNYVMTESFQIKFTAFGENSADIRAWFIDNILIYRSCEPAPIELQTSIIYDPEITDDNGIFLDWNYPQDPSVVDEWMGYDDGMNDNALGTAAANTLGAAIKLTPEMLAAYENMSFDQMTMFIADEVAEVEIHVWKGEEMAELVSSSIIDLNAVSFGDWNTFDLTAPITIEPAVPYYVGYTVNSIAEKFPLGIDANVGAPGYSDLISMDGITFESAYAVTDGQFDINWNLKVHVSGTVEGIIPNSTQMHIVYNTSNDVELMKSDKQSQAVNFKNSKAASRAEIEFLIYRKNTATQTEFEMIGSTQETGYLDPENVPENNLESGVFYEYQVTAVLTESDDSCETDPSNTEGELWKVGLDETLSIRTTVFPNPTDAKTMVVSDETINRVWVSNKIGQIRSIEDVHAESCELDLGGLAPGIYLIHIETASETFVKKITVI